MASSKIPRTCEQCGETFEALASKVRQGVARFCSRPCVAQFQSRTIFRICEHCGGSFKTVPNRIKDNRAKFCSTQCVHAHQSIPLETRFYQRVGPPNENGCTLWTGGTAGEYGSVWRDNKSVSAHHVAFELAGGVVPKGHCVLHRCDTPLCCTPAHLFTGTHVDNMMDKVQKNRQAKGEVVGSAKLTAAIVRSARERYRNKTARGIDLAIEYGVHKGTMGNALRGTTWKHV